MFIALYTESGSQNFNFSLFRINPKVLSLLLCYVEESISLQTHFPFISNKMLRI